MLSHTSAGHSRDGTSEARERANLTTLRYSADIQPSYAADIFRGVIRKLTMHHVDFRMIDASQNPWFDLDLVNYQAPLVNGYARMTAQAGFEIFMLTLV